MASKYETPGGIPAPEPGYPYSSPFEEWLNNAEVSSLADLARRWNVKVKNIRVVSAANQWMHKREVAFRNKGMTTVAGLKVEEADGEFMRAVIEQYERGDITVSEMQEKLVAPALRSLLAHMESSDGSLSLGANKEMLSYLMQKPSTISESILRYEREAPGDLADMFDHLGRLSDDL